MARPSNEGPPIRPSNEGFLATPAAAAKPEQWKDELNAFFCIFLLSQDKWKPYFEAKKFKGFSRRVDDITCIVGAIMEFPPGINLSPR